MTAVVLGVSLLLYFDVLRLAAARCWLSPLALAARLAASLNAAVRTWLGWRPERNLLERCWRGGCCLVGTVLLSALARPFTTANQPPKSCAERGFKTVGQIFGEFIFLAFPPLSRAAGHDGATRQDHPSQGHGSSPAAFHQIPRCMPDSSDSIAPGQFSSSPDFDAELPAVPAPQRVMLHPHQLHSSTSRELLAYPW